VHENPAVKARIESAKLVLRKEPAGGADNYTPALTKTKVN